MRKISPFIVAALLLGACGGESNETVPDREAAPASEAVSPPVTSDDLAGQPGADSVTSEPGATAAEDVTAGEGSAEQADAMTAQWFALNCPTEVVALDDEATPWGMVSGPIAMPEDQIPSSGLRLYTYDELSNVMTPVAMLTAETPMCLSTDEDYRESLRKPLTARDANTGETDGFMKVNVPGGPLYTTVVPPARLAIKPDLESAKASRSTWWEVHPLAQLEEATQSPVTGSVDRCDYHGVECGG